MWACPLPLFYPPPSARLTQVPPPFTLKKYFDVSLNTATVLPTTISKFNTGTAPLHSEEILWHEPAHCPCSVIVQGLGSGNKKENVPSGSESYLNKLWISHIHKISASGIQPKTFVSNHMIVFLRAAVPADCRVSVRPPVIIHQPPPSALSLGGHGCYHLPLCRLLCLHEGTSTFPPVLLIRLKNDNLKNAKKLEIIVVKCTFGPARLFLLLFLSNFFLSFSTTGTVQKSFHKVIFY